MGYLAIAIGIALAGYFIGEGIKNVGKGNGSDNMSMETFKHLFENNDQLIKEKNLHTFLGISKTDAQTITQRYPDIPHVTLNGNNYFPKSQLREWVKKIG